MQKQDIVVDVKNVSHSYSKGTGGDFPVLDNTNLTLHENEIVCLLGRSGAGKSTLLRIISGLIRPTRGSVTLGDTLITQPHQNIAMVFQNFALFPWLTVLENVELGLEAQYITPKERHSRALKAIDLIGLDGNENAYPRELSGGMQQRVGLARALVVKPSLLLLDEPFSALDVLTAEILRSDLLDIWIEGRMLTKSIFMVTHNIEEAVLMADRILLFGSNPGRIISEIHVSMTQPRNRLSPDFRTLVDSIYEKLTAKEGPPTGKKGAFPGMGIGMILPYISTNILQGFLETLATVYNGEADLPKLSEILSNQDEGREILKIAETLQLLRFCELDGADVRLTTKGKKFVLGNIDDRKKLFRDHLLAYIPLAAHIRGILNECTDNQIPMNRFLSEIEDYMPQESAQVTMKTLISWARYAELFAYDEKTGKFYLED